MKAGQFNIYDYLEKLEKLNEESTPMMDGGEGVSNAEGIVIPDTNKKSYDWLKKEYNAKQTEVKVEISGQGASFKPGYDLQTNLDSVKDFKPGMFGEVKTADTQKDNKSSGKKEPASLDAKKDQPTFQKGEGEKDEKEKKDETSKTKTKPEDIKNKEGEKEEKGKEKEEEHKDQEKEKEPKKEEGEAKVKKLDLKTKKKDDDKE
jgi:hypothetical protein